jgi:hypothetical protein
MGGLLGKTWGWPRSTDNTSAMCAYVGRVTCGGVVSAVFGQQRGA